MFNGVCSMMCSPGGAFPTDELLSTLKPRFKSWVWFFGIFGPYNKVKV